LEQRKCFFIKNIWQGDSFVHIGQTGYLQKGKAFDIKSNLLIQISLGQSNGAQWSELSAAVQRV